METSGPNTGGDRIYSIWDGGGEDTIDASALTAAALIDLRPGYFSSIGPQSDVQIAAGTAPSVTTVGTLNISIAFGAYIENAKGSSAGDLLIGNILTNKLEGGAGNDVIYAEGADSIHDVGNGDYSRVTSVGASKTEAAPTFVQAFIDDPASQLDHLLGGAGDDYLHGGRGNDLIEGGADDDHIVGGGGDDEIWGGDKDDAQGATEGTDTVTYAAGAAGITISFNGAGEDTSLTVADGAGGNDTLHSIERIVATSHTDYLYYNGEIPDGYVLEIDMGSELGDVVANAAGASTSIQLLIDGSGTGTLKGTGPGTIHLLNATTQIIGSIHDDEITDLAEHDGVKRINGGLGDDVITIGGSDAMILGGGGDDVIDGGEGKDIIVGSVGPSSEFNQLNGGGGSDYILGNSANDVIDGGEGHDHIKAFSGSTVRGGGGNDVLDFGASSGDVIFGAGAGRDFVIASDPSGNNDDMHVIVEGLSVGDVTVIVEDIPGHRCHLAIVAGADSLVLLDVPGGDSYAILHIFFGGSSEPTHWNELTVVAGSVAQYIVAPSDYAAAVAADPGETTGTAGNDDLAGGIGDDEIAGGDGDDAFQSSGGTDEIDGGAGSDSLFLFGARSDFIVDRDALTGDLTLTNRTGLEGAITLKSVEKVYFAADNEEFDPYQLITYSGTPGDDALVQGDSNDNLIYGLAGDDLLRGLGGDDRLDGGAGADAMEGGAGDDWYVVGHPGDTVIEGAAEGAQDRVFASTSYTLSAGAYVEILSTNAHAGTAAINLGGNALNNLIYGNAGNNSIDGKVGADTMVGFGGNDWYYVDNAGDRVVEGASEGALDRVFASASLTLSAGAHIENLSTNSHAGTAAINLSGNELGNLIYGNAGSNVIDGKSGNDTLSGFGGTDSFAFTTALGAGNVDRIADFDADDLIALDNAVFTGLGLGALSAIAFRTGTAAQDGDDRIVYNQATGQLYYDADGNGAGAQVLFATLSGNPVLTASDFSVI